MGEFKQEPYVYLNQEPRAKDYYPKAYELIRKNKFRSVLDIGCASGDFFALLPYSEVKCYGIDISAELIEHANARNQNNNTEFYCVDVLNNEKQFDSDIDFVTCFGTATAIDDLNKLIGNLIDFKPKLIMFVETINPNGLDIKCGYRRNTEDKFNFAYNIRCFDSWKNEIAKFEGYSITFEAYKMDTKLVRSGDPIRNFHSNVDGEIVQRNGLDLILHYYQIFVEREGC